MEKGNTKREILDAALSLFSTQGFEATSVSQIADAVGIRKASLYSHFASKQEILELLMTQVLEQYNKHSIFIHKLLTGIKALLNMPDADEAFLTEQLRLAFEAEGFHAFFGKTQGYYGPYIWRDTVPTVYCVELPSGTAEYTINILKGFVFRSWIDYLTFGRYGTKGWASPDGTINCVEQAYDFESERFRVSLLKHEAQHTVDMKQFSEITPAELEYRAKLVELHYSSDLSLLQKILSEADENKTDDAHATASARIGRGFADTDKRSLSCIQTRALELFNASTKEMEEKYGKLKVGFETGKPD